VSCGGSQKTYESGKVGDDIALQFRLVDKTGAALALESASVTIRTDAGALTIDAAAGDLVASNIAEYVWTPDEEGDYDVEWHGKYGGDLDIYSATGRISIGPRLAT